MKKNFANTRKSYIVFFRLKMKPCILPKPVSYKPVNYRESGKTEQLEYHRPEKPTYFVRWVQKEKKKGKFQKKKSKAGRLELFVLYCVYSNVVTSNNSIVRLNKSNIPLIVGFITIAL